MANLHFYALFKMCDRGCHRFNTRIYLNGEPSKSGEGDCVGAFVGKNPGSASPGRTPYGEWGELEEDNTLRMVGNCFQEAYSRANLAIPHLAYVQIWNLFYWCNPNLKLALSECKNLETEICQSESLKKPEVVWFGWGGAHSKLNELKTRFEGIPHHNSFYYDWNLEKVVSARPSKEDFAKHPQGLSSEPIVSHLVELFKKRFIS